MTGEQLLFVILAVAACCGAVAVVVVQNVVRMAFWLIVSLASTAGLFFLLEADFVGATQLLVYVGGTLVLLIFGVMLTASGPYLKIQSSLRELLLGGLVGTALLFTTVGTLLGVNWTSLAKRQGAVPPSAKSAFNPRQQGNTVRPIGLALLGLRPDKDLQGQQNQLSTGYLLPFEIVSVHLLVVLIGATYLARSKRRKATHERPGES